MKTLDLETEWEDLSGNILVVLTNDERVASGIQYIDFIRNVGLISAKISVDSYFLYSGIHNSISFDKKEVANGFYDVFPEEFQYYIPDNAEDYKIIFRMLFTATGEIK
jgi:hypothetical protein